MVLGLRLVGLSSLALGLGCASIPAGRFAVDEVAVHGGDAVPAGDVEESLATAPSPRFLGIFQGVVHDYTLYDRLAFQRDVARVERYYRARGYYEARARAGRVRQTGAQHVEVEIVVEEGPAVRVGDVRVEGLSALPKEVVAYAESMARAELSADEPFDEDHLESAEKALKDALVERSYAYATVSREAIVDLVTHRADMVLRATPGEPAFFGPVTLEGLGKLPDAPVRRALDLAEGDPYSAEVLLSAQQALLDLGVFASVEITPDLSAPSASRRVPLRVRVVPTRLHTVKLGGGVELDAIKADVHLLASWEHRNFLGGMRFFSVEFRPGAVLYPTRLGNLTAPTDLLLAEKTRVELRQPGFFEARTNGLLRAELNVFPVLIETDPDPDSPVLGYQELRAAAGVDRVLWKVYSAFAYHLDVENPFAYLGDLDPALRVLVLSFPELTGTFDLRDDRLRPHRGVFVSAHVQAAGGPLGGDASDVRIQPEARGYIPLGKHITLGVRASLGLLFPRNYGDLVQAGAPPPTTEAERVELVRDLQIVYFRGFFSGGPNSNRGYPQRGVGPRGVVPFLNPAAGACTGDVPSSDPGTCSLPTGGLSLLEASGEVRFDITGPFSGALFCDASDVSAKEADLRFGHLHLSCGPGVRYATPIGPIRLDVGYRIPGMQVLGGEVEEGSDPGDLWGLPIAVAFGIGEAF
jgi:outer membrane protein assembly factor BamA